MSFSGFAQNISQLCGRSTTFVVVCALMLIWLASGPYFGFSDSWQLVANTVTTLATTLVVFIIQNTQNRDTAAIKLQLAELVRATEHARNRFVSLEDLTEDQLKALAERYAALARQSENR